MTIGVKELERIVHGYSNAFPGWKVLNRHALVREGGPVLQGILFNRASNDVYRPMSFVRVLAAPDENVGLSMDLPCYLRYPNGASQRTVRLRDHEIERDDVARELRRQIVPSIDRPLDAQQVLNLYEAEARTRARTAEAYSLAALNAYLGHDERARWWIERYRVLLPDDESRWQEWELRRLRFLESLEQWLDEGVAMKELDEVIRQERKAIGLAD